MKAYNLEDIKPIFELNGALNFSEIKCLQGYFSFFMPFSEPNAKTSAEH